MDFDRWTRTDRTTVLAVATVQAIVLLALLVTTRALVLAMAFVANAAMALFVLHGGGRPDGPRGSVRADDAAMEAARLD